MTAVSDARTELTPNRQPLTVLQAERLSGLSGISLDELVGKSVAEIDEQYRWLLNPDWLLFVQICGTVVQLNPANGEQYPVPYATVYAEDTVCSVLGYFPELGPWAWFFPWECRTEVVAQTTTDACGNFCVWVPRFELEWILRWRLERVCYLEVFRKPTISDVLAYLQGGPPDPGGPVTLQPGTDLYQRAEQLVGSQLTQRLSTFDASPTFGSSTTEQRALLGRPAFPTSPPPPLSSELRRPTDRNDREGHRNAVRSTLANKLNLAGEALADLDLGHYCGPFLRCFDVLIPEWVPILEIPDISFRVTQDVTGTGVQEVIYSGGLFDVPWGSGTTDVTLYASPIAVANPLCNTPEVPCGDEPTLEYVGLMPLENPPLPAPPFVDTVTTDALYGFALRPNPPSPSGNLTGPTLLPASAPFSGTLQLYGCTQVDGAEYYRLLYTYTAPGSTTVSAIKPFVGLTWPLYREVGLILQTLWPVSDSNGWYPVLDSGDDWFPASMVLEWDTGSFQDGLYSVQLQVGDAGKAPLATSPAVGFVIDNSPPKVTYSAIWSFESDMSSPQPLPTDECAVIDRGIVPADVYVQLSFSVSAEHLRSVQVGTGGCGGNDPVLQTSITPLSAVQHWYEDEGDNTFGSVALYKIPASFPQGVYSFNIYAASRAFNPAGSDSGPLDDWLYSPVYIWSNPSFSTAVVNEPPT